MPPNHAVRVMSAVAPTRPRPLRASHDTPGSIMEMEELRAAMLISRKNRLPSHRPPGIWAKVMGRVTNNKPGPAPGSRP